MAMVKASGCNGTFGVATMLEQQGVAGRRVRRRSRIARGRHLDADRRAERRFGQLDLMLDYRLETGDLQPTSLQSFAETVRNGNRLSDPRQARPACTASIRTVSTR